MYYLYSCCFTTKGYFVRYSFCHVNYRISSIYLLIFITENRVYRAMIQQKNKAQLGKKIGAACQMCFLGLGFGLGRGGYY